MFPEEDFGEFDETTQIPDADAYGDEEDPEAVVDSGVFGRSAPSFPDALQRPRAVSRPSAFGGSPSPDGLGGSLEEFIEPDDVSDASAARSAGLTMLGAVLFAGAGYAIRGGLGAVSGALLFGALANGYRAQKWWKSDDPSEKHEAIVSAVFAAGGLAAGGYVGYKARKS